MIVLVPFVLYTLYTVAGKSLQTYRMIRDTAAIRAEIEAEKRENQLLQQELIAARSDQQVEDLARRYLNMAKPGDHAVVLVGAPVPTPPVRAPVKAEPPEELPPWLDWLLNHLGL